MCLFDPGDSEHFKGGFHAVLGLLALGACGYNAIAFARRKEAHLAVNMILYGAIVALEVTHVNHHRQHAKAETE